MTGRPDWHSDEYAAKRVEGIRTRPPMYQQNAVLNDDIAWLIEEIERLRAERDEARGTSASETA